MSSKIYWVERTKELELINAELLEVCRISFNAIKGLTLEECSKPLGNDRILGIIQTVEKLEQAVAKTERKEE